MSTARPQWLMLLLTIAALLLGLLALSAGAVGLSDHADATDRVVMLVNWLTGLTGIGGALGYALNKRWGIYLFGVSALGHIGAHTQLYLSGIASGRSGSILLFGLAIVPVAALCVLAGMTWEHQRQGHRT